VEQFGRKWRKTAYHSVLDKMFKVFAFDTILQHTKRQNPVVADGREQAVPFWILFHNESIGLAVTFGLAERAE
jgi:hypothetical protein